MFWRHTAFHHFHFDLRFTRSGRSWQTTELIRSDEERDLVGWEVTSSTNHTGATVAFVFSRSDLLVLV